LNYASSVRIDTWDGAIINPVEARRIQQPPQGKVRAVEPEAGLRNVLQVGHQFDV
jgi:hypothetical protein